MTNFKWSILEIFADAEKVTKVRYLLKANDGTNTVETEGYHDFSEGLVSKKLADIKEKDLIGWLESDTLKNEVNPIKLNLQNQLNTLENDQKVGFPWLTDTFTME